MWIAKAARVVLDSIILLAVGAVLAGWLLRVAPGASVDEHDLDPRLTKGTRDQYAQRREASRNAVARSFDWFAGVFRGELGKSETSGDPVTSVIAERAPLTLRTVAGGAAGGFVLGICTAAFGVLGRPGIKAAFTGTSILVLAFPSALLALAALFLRMPVEVAVIVAVTPRIYLYAVELFGPHVRGDWMLAARAAGVPVNRIVIRYLLPALRNEMTALAGLSVLSAMTVTIPAEVLTGRPGLGQLAWTSARERDLPVVVAVTLAMAIIARGVTVLSSLPERQGDAA